MNLAAKSIAAGWKLLILALLLPTAPTVGAPEPSSPREIDRIIVIINNDVITDSELGHRLDETKKQLALEKIKTPPDPVLRKQLLERVVLERLQLQLAAQLGIRVSDSDVDQAIESIARGNNLTVEAFRDTLNKSGIDPASHREQIREQIILQQLQDREIANRINVTESEINNFLENPQSQADMGVSYELSHILIGIPENASSEAILTAKKRAEDIYRQLKGGDNFEQMAVSYSQGADALRGGNLGWRQAGELPELFIGALKNMARGDISDVLRGPNGFHILKLNNKRGDTQTESVTQTHVRHILLRQSEIQSLDEARNKLLALRDRIENGDDFAALARSHSEDTGTAANGGDLGWVNPGQLVPPFEKAMDALSPNKLSQPVRTSFGLHLIEVLDRRRQDVTQQRQLNNARQQIHKRKIDERFEQWVRQLRDEAYVEYVQEDVN
jgi:peptidyl-prolyl cis-trans isomerase SurA